jgi:hypothetical protein
MAAVRALGRVREANMHKLISRQQYPPRQQQPGQQPKPQPQGRGAPTRLERARQRSAVP